MIDHTAMQLAMRVKLLTLLVSTTGATNLSATATGYHRAAGSFITDGFAEGMEVGPGGFAQNTIVGTITAITDTDLTIGGGCTAEAVGGGRTLTVGLPTLRAWENEQFTPQAGVPYVEEQYVPGPETLLTIGPGGIVEVRPMYSPRIYVPDNTGILADGRYADAIKTLFAPRTAMALPNGDILQVRGDQAPFRGQRVPSPSAGWSCIPITIPFRLRTRNSL